jgi:hypothetical protein
MPAQYVRYLTRQKKKSTTKTFGTIWTRNIKKSRNNLWKRKLVGTKCWNSWNLTTLTSTKKNSSTKIPLANKQELNIPQIQKIKLRKNKAQDKNLKTTPAQKFMKKIITNQWNHKICSKLSKKWPKREFWLIRTNTPDTREQSTWYQGKDWLWIKNWLPKGTNTYDMWSFD